MRILIKVSGNHTTNTCALAFIRRWIDRGDVDVVEIICGAGSQINDMLRHDFGWDPVYDDEGNRQTMRPGEWEATKQVLIKKAERLKKALPSRKAKVHPCISNLGEISLPINGDVLFRRLMSTGKFERGFVITKPDRLLKKARIFSVKKSQRTTFISIP